MNKRDIKRFAREHPEFADWANRHASKLKPYAKQRNYKEIVQEWERSTQPLLEQRKMMAHQIAESMRDVQSFMQNVETVFNRIKQLHGKAKNLKR
jgi:hypothetical protein